MARRALPPASLATVQAVAVLPPAPWVVACSGGSDSLALAWAVAHVSAQRRTPARALVVDHGLQAGSADVAAGVVAELARLNLPGEMVRVTVTADGSGPEAAARTARYAALAASAQVGERVLLGHTLDDQAETVLLGLARGSGTRSLAGMPPSRGVFDRPLLGLRRAVLESVCAEQGLRPWHDPHNDDPGFTRVRVRSRVLPVLEDELGPGIVEALARTATLARLDADALDAAATLVADGDPHCAHLAGLDPAVRLRVLRDWLTGRGVTDLTATHLDAVDRLITAWRGQKGVDVPGGRVARVNGGLTLRPHSQ